MRKKQARLLQLRVLGDDVMAFREAVDLPALHLAPKGYLHLLLLSFHKQGHIQHQSKANQTKTKTYGWMKSQNLKLKQNISIKSCQNVCIFLC